MYDTIRYEKNEGIGVLTISRPQALNALNSAVIADLEAVMAEIERDGDLRVLILTGEGRSFVAGADIGEMSSMGAAEGRSFGRRGSAVMRRIERIRPGRRL